MSFILESGAKFLHYFPYYGMAKKSAKDAHVAIMIRSEPNSNSLLLMRYPTASKDLVRQLFELSLRTEKKNRRRNILTSLAEVVHENASSEIHQMNTGSDTV